MNSAEHHGTDDGSSPTTQQWESFKDLIRDLWIGQDLPLADVREELERHGHIASVKHYKDRLKAWGFGKYTSKQDWQAFVVLRARAKVAKFDLDEINIRGKIRRTLDLEKYLRKREMLEADLLQEAKEEEGAVPDHVQWQSASIDSKEQCAALKGLEDFASHSCEICVEKFAPSVQDTKMLAVDPPPSSVQGSSAGANNAFGNHGVQHDQYTLLSRENDSDAWTPIHLQKHQPYSSHTASELAMYFENIVEPERGIMPTRPSYIELLEMTGQVNIVYGVRGSYCYNSHEVSIGPKINRFQSSIVQPSAQTRTEQRRSNGGQNFTGALDLSLRGELFDPLSDTPAAESAPDTAKWYMQTDEHNALMTDAFMACMSGASGDLDFLGLWLGQAILKFDAMCAAKDPLLLVVVHQILVWLQTHDDSSRPESIMRALSRVATHALGKDSLIAIMLEHMTAATGKRLSNNRIDSKMLRRVVNDFSESLGPEHPHLIVARYYLSFHMLGVDCKSQKAGENLVVEVEEALTDLYHTISKVLGQSSFLAVCVLATLSRAQSRQGKHNVALTTIRQCKKAAPLGLNHPHRLEILKREALLCGKIKDKFKDEEETERMSWDKEMEDLYWLVVRGRVATLGKRHKDTEKAHDTLVQILKENGRWEMMKDKAQQLLTDPPMSVDAYESWWQSMVPKDREGEARPAPGEGEETD